MSGSGMFLNLGWLWALYLVVAMIALGGLVFYAWSKRDNREKKIFWQIFLMMILICAPGVYGVGDSYLHGTVFCKTCHFVGKMETAIMRYEVSVHAKKVACHNCHPVRVMLYDKIPKLAEASAWKQKRAVILAKSCINCHVKKFNPDATPMEKGKFHIYFASHTKGEHPTACVACHGAYIYREHKGGGKRREAHYFHPQKNLCTRCHKEDHNSFYQVGS